MIFLLRLFRRLIKQNLAEIERHSRVVLILYKTYTITRNALKLFIVQNFILTSMLFLLILGTYVFFHPSIVGKTKCYLYKIEYDKLVPSNHGRDCQPGNIVALVWGALQPDGTNTGSMLMRDSVLLQEDYSNKSQWVEVYLPKSEKLLTNKDGSIYRNFVFDTANTDAEADFQVGSCDAGYPENREKQNSEVNFEVRRGFTLHSDIRAGITTSLSDIDQTICNAADYQDKKKTYCGWGRLEFFIPSKQPAALCTPKAPLDYWLSRSRVDLGERPYLCLRGIDLNGTPVGPWHPFAVIRSVWCD